jgi:hypothetical protein
MDAYFDMISMNPMGMLPPFPGDLYLQTVIDLAAEGFGGMPSVKTFVISIGVGGAQTNMQNPALAGSNADKIAAAGGSGQAFNAGGADTAQQFLDALDRIASSVGCTFMVPQPENRTPNPDQLNFTFTPEGQPKELYPRVPDSAACADHLGWFYDDPAAPTRIDLCPAACDRLLDGEGLVEIVIGCQTVLL